MNIIKEVLASDIEIFICSDEGEKKYMGKRTLTALKSRLTKESKLVKENFRRNKLVYAEYEFCGHTFIFTGRT